VRTLLAEVIYWGKADIKGDKVKGLYPELCGQLGEVIGRIEAISKANER
jgi:hypothetical protein